MSRLLFAVLSICVVFSMAIVIAADEGSYIGFAKCKGCHKSSKVGNQTAAWEKGPHAGTYTQLASDESKEIAKKAGVEGDPQKSEKCLKCHITAYGVADERKADTLTMEEGISCEACHGAGSKYKTLHIKKKDAAKEAGFIVKPTEESCKKCHNPESPTYKEFKYEEKLKKIAHPKPAK